MTYLREPPSWLEELEDPGSDVLPEDPWDGPAWSSVEPPCECTCCSEPLCSGTSRAAASPDAPPLPELPGVSAPVALLQSALTHVMSTDPVDLPGAQALVDAEALLGIAQALRVHNLGRLADVHSRQLHELADSRAASTWVKRTAPDTEPSDLSLARSLRAFATLDALLRAGSVTLAAAKRCSRELIALRPYVDRPDGRIDGQPAAEVVPAVVRHVVALICQSRLGLGSDDPLLAQLHAEVEGIVADGGSDLLQLEKAFGLLARHVPAAMLKECLQELSGALLPNLLEERADRGRDQAGLVLRRKSDGSGFDVRGDLDLETGELLFQALAAEARRDGANPDDTADAEVLRHQGIDPFDPAGPFTPDADGTFGLPAAEVPFRWPRTKARRLHDALKLLLERYLAADLGGTRDKQPVRLSVTVSSDLLENRPGAPPAVAASGARLPRSLVQQWWCNARVTAFVLTRGWVPIGASHTQRTLSASERTALDLQSGGRRCAGLGCCPGTPDPLSTLEPHHVEAFEVTGTTSLRDSIWACPTLHHDLHHGKTVLLRSGRRLNARGWAPS